MKVIQSWKRNMTATDGYSITVSYTYSSKHLSEIEEIEKKLSTGIKIFDTDEPKRIYPESEISPT